MKTSRKLLLAAAVLGTVGVAGCASDPYHDYAYNDRYTYTQPGYAYTQPGYTYYGPRQYSQGYYYYGPRAYSYSRPDPFWRYQPSPG